MAGFALDAREVALEDGEERGVGDRGREALDLARLREERAGGDRGDREALGEAGRDRPLRLGRRAALAKAADETDGDRLDVRGAEGLFQDLD